MIKNFSQYLVEEEREAFFTFGRMNPPTIGHGKVIDTIVKKAKGSDYKIFLSQSQGPKDPLSYSDKVKHMRKMFPKHGRNIIVDKKVKTAFDVAVKLYDMGYRKITMVVGQDRLREFDTLLNKYNGTKARHGFYNFESINVVSAGQRDPDAEGVEGMSASKQRANAKANDYQAFTQGVPKSMSDRDTRKLFNDVRKGMGLKEERSFKRHIDLGKLDDTREAYVSGDLFEIGDTVVVKESDEVGIVSVLGANYVIVECGDKKLRKWLNAVELVEKKLTPAELKKREEIAKAIEKDNPDMPMDKKMAIATATAKRVAEKKAPQDPDIGKDVKGTQPAKYYAKDAEGDDMSDATKKKRAAHFKKGAAKSDEDPTAYKPAPGDKGAKTKPSKYTKSFKQMYGESGAGEEGTDKLVKKYKKDTPMQENIEEKYFGKTGAFGDKSYGSTLFPAFDQWMDKKVYNKKKYEKAVRGYLNWRRKNPKAGSVGAFDYLRSMGVERPRLIINFMHDMIKQGKLPKHLHLDKGVERAGKAVKKAVKTSFPGQDFRGLQGEDAVAQAKDRIKAEKERDKKKFDSMLDRARIARAKAKNRATK